MTPKMNGSIRAICAVIGVVMLLACATGAWYDHKLETQQVNDKVVSIKTDGCDPAKEGVTSIAVINTRLDNLDDSIEDLSVQQTNNTTLIIEEIKRGRSDP